MVMVMNMDGSSERSRYLKQKQLLLRLMWGFQDGTAK